MEDREIIALYWARDEAAIRESDRRYGRTCRRVANSILASREDTEECVSSTWLRAWETMPPQRPTRLGVFLAAITRHLAIDRWRHDTAQQRGGGQVPLCLDELAECVGEETSIEDRMVLRQTLETFLRGLTEQERRLFLYRYWYLMIVREAAGRCGLTVGAAKMRLLRLRQRLREALEQEGIEV